MLEHGGLGELRHAAGAKVKERSAGAFIEAAASPSSKRSGVPGDRMLYVGDHIYGDVLRAKKESAWRTLMIIQELDRRADRDGAARNGEISRLDKLEQRLAELHDGLRERQAMIKALQRALEEPEITAERRVELEAARVRMKRAADRMRMQAKQVEAEHSELDAKVDTAFHPYWGSALKAESELSSFGEQVERYACLYSDRVTNLLSYTAAHYFRGPRHRMSHE